MPGLEWPIRAADLRPYYSKAADLLGVNRDVAEMWQPDATEGLIPIERYATGEDERRMGPHNHDEFASSEVRVILNASVAAIEPSWNGQVVRSVLAKTLTGKQFTVEAKVFVLATGAIENARLMMLPTSISDAGIGNQHGLVGRNYCDHIYGRGLILETNSPWTSHGEWFNMVAPEILDDLKLPQLGVLRIRDRPDAEHADEAVSTFAGLLDQVPTPRLGRVTYYIEVPSAPENRVTLGDEPDPFGNPRAELTFHFSEQMHLNYRKRVEQFAIAVGRAGLGRVQAPGSFLGGANHHMHTTRMGDDPSTSVVDADCRVHNVSNLYVAGSSVFPSSGCGNPTFPLIALTFRLADHLAEAVGTGQFA